MDVLLTPSYELYKLHSHAPLLKKSIKILSEAKEHEKRGDAEKAVHGYLKVDGRLTKILRDEKKNCFDIHQLQELHEDVQNAVRNIDPLGLIEESIQKKHQNKMKSKISKALTDTSSAVREQNKVIFINKDGLNVLDFPQKKSNTTPTASSSKIIKVPSNTISVFYPLKAIPQFSLLKFNQKKKEKSLKKVQKIPSTDTFLKKNPNSNRKSVIENMDLEMGSFRSISRHSMLMSSMTGVMIPEKLNLAPLDLANYTKETIEETYAMLLKCIFFPISHIVSTQATMNLIQNSFHFSKQKHTEIEDTVIDSCSFQSIIALLNAQLESLNNHPFYTRESFKTEEDYNHFVQSEEKRIGNLLNELKIHKLNKVVPAPQLKNYHEHYTILLKSLVKFEITKNELKSEAEYVDIDRNLIMSPSLNNRREKTAQPLLSPLSCWLLLEFSERFGIRKLYQMIMLFDIFSNILEPKENSLLLTYELGKQIFSEIKSNQEPITITEENLFSASVRRLHHSIKAYFIDFPKTFKTFNCFKHLKLMIDLLNLLCEVDYYLPNSKEKLKAEDLIVNYLKQSSKNRFNSILERNKSEYKEGETVLQLQNLIDEITLEIGGMLIYEKEFRNYCDITLVIAETYFSLLEVEIVTFFEKSAKLYSPKEVLTLCTKLSLLNKRFPVIKQKFEVTKLFSPYLTSWLDELNSNFLNWIKNSIGNDKWVPLDKDTLITNSVVDLFCMLMEPVSFISQLSENIVSDDTQTAPNFMSIYGKVVSDIILMYVSKLESSILQEFPENLRKTFETYQDSQMNPVILSPSVKPKKRTIIGKIKTKWNTKVLQKNKPKTTTATNTNDRDSNESYSITEKICYRMNNIEFSRTRLVEVLADVDSNDFEKMFDALFPKLKDKLDAMMNLNILSMNIRIKRDLSNYMKDTTKPTDVVLTYVDRELETLHDYLLAPLFKKFLSKLWNFILDDISTYHQHKLKQKQQKHMKTLMDDLKMFFNANGSGLSEKQIRESLIKKGLNEYNNDP